MCCNALLTKFYTKMNKGFILLLLTIFTIGIVNAQSSKQYTLLTKQTADWCPRCGDWGWTFAKNALTALDGENVIFWGMHFSGGLATPTSKAVAENFDLGYQPVFFLNQDDQGVTSSNVAAKVASVKETVKLLNGFPALFKVGVTASIDGNNNITADAKVKIEEGTESDYYLALYLIRDKLVAYQASQGNAAVHPFLLDNTFYEGKPFGQLVNDGNTIVSGDLFEFNTTLEKVTPHTTDITDMKVAAVLWYKVGEEYTFINGDIQPVQLQSSANEVDQLQFTYFIKGNNINLNFEDKISNDAQLSLFGLDGKSYNVSDQNINEFSLSANLGQLVAGAYIVRIIDGNKVGSRQIYIVD